jgi:hypothetical protein
MRTRFWSLFLRTAPLSKRLASALGIILLAATCASSARAQVTLGYSFEPDLEGFHFNGGGVTITQDTIGATEGTHSMKFSIVQGATFVGALTGNLVPEIGDPPGLDFVLFDLTLTEQFPTPGFVRSSISIFGRSKPDSAIGEMGGLHVQFFDDEVSFGELTPGTHPIRIDLTSAFDPVRFVNGSFNEIMGTEESDPNDIIPTGFQIYVNKSSNAPWTGYIDNIRFGRNPPAADADFNDDTFVDAADLAIWKGALGSTAAGDADGDLDSDGEDFLVWQRQLGPQGGVAAVPEPATFGLAAAILLALFGSRTSVAPALPGAMRNLRR